MTTENRPGGALEQFDYRGQAISLSERVTGWALAKNMQSDEEINRFDAVGDYLSNVENGDGREQDQLLPSFGMSDGYRSHMMSRLYRATTELCEERYAELAEANPVPEYEDPDGEEMRSKHREMLRQDEKLMTLNGIRHAARIRARQLKKTATTPRSRSMSIQNLASRPLPEYDMPQESRVEV